MFGRDENHDEATTHEPQHDAVLGDSGATVQPEDHTSPAYIASSPADSGMGNDSDNTTPLPAPVADESAEPDTDTIAPASSFPADRPDASGGENSDLIDIKQSALKELGPLVGHLDQTPEEKFRTTMMMIQASDDQELIPVAHEAAQKIADEKTKAQALLDIVNEINYFTQH